MDFNSNLKKFTKEQYAFITKVPMCVFKGKPIKAFYRDMDTDTWYCEHYAVGELIEISHYLDDTC